MYFAFMCTRALTISGLSRAVCELKPFFPGQKITALVHSR